MGSSSFGSVGLKTALSLGRSGFGQRGVTAVDRGDRVDRVDLAGGVFKVAMAGELDFRLATAIGLFGFDGDESG